MESSSTGLARSGVWASPEAAAVVLQQKGEILTLASREFRSGRLSWAAVILAAVVSSLPASASEALGDLDLRLSVVEIRTDYGQDSGIAVIDATLGAFAPARDIRIELFRSDGTGLAPATLPFDPGPLTWFRAGETSPVTLGNVLTLGARDRVAARFEVSLERPGIYELVLKAVGTSAAGPVRTEAMAVLPLGVDLVRPVEFEGAVEFRAVPSGEVQP